MEPFILPLVMSAGFLLNVLLTPLIIRVAHRNGWYDARNHRKVHVDDTPRIGGVGIYLSLLATTGLAVALGAVDGSVSAGEPALTLWPIFIGMTAIHAMGLVDDFRNLSAAVKLVVQIAAAAVVTLGPLRLERLTIPFVWYQLELGAAGIPLTILWIVAVSNAVNFMDGLDGLAGGVCAVAALLLAVVAAILGQSLAGVVSAGLFGALVAFLVFNAPKARIFMGDSGAYVLGFVLSVVPLMLGRGSGGSLDLIPASTVLALPLLDMATSVARRMHRGRHPMVADREHLHHKLMDLGLAPWSIIAVAWGSTIVMGAAAVLWYVLPIGLNMGVVLLAWTTAVFLVIWLNRSARTHPSGTE